MLCFAMQCYTVSCCSLLNRTLSATPTGRCLAWPCADGAVPERPPLVPWLICHIILYYTMLYIYIYTHISHTCIYHLSLSEGTPWTRTDPQLLWPCGFLFQRRDKTTKRACKVLRISVSTSKSKEKSRELAKYCGLLYQHRILNEEEITTRELAKFADFCFNVCAPPIGPWQAPSQDKARAQPPGRRPPTNLDYAWIRNI